MQPKQKMMLFLQLKSKSQNLHHFIEQNENYGIKKYYRKSNNNIFFYFQNT